MSKFTTPAILEILGHYLCRVHERFEFYLPTIAATISASLQDSLQTLRPCRVSFGRFYHQMEDMLKLRSFTIICMTTRSEADLIFLDGMGVLGVTKWKRIVMYWAVGIFGRGKY